MESVVNAIEFKDVSLAFDEKVILNNVSFAVKPGETKIVLGGSGTGKSTILRLTLGLIKPDSGRILIDGEDITDYSESQLTKVRQKIGMVFQEGALFDSLSVHDNVAYKLYEQKAPEKTIEETVRRMLNFVNLEDAIHKLPNELSGGMRRRVGIARALVGDPKIILYDEPTAGLDPPTARAICELAVRLRDLKNVSSMFVTHRIDDVKLLSSLFVAPDGDGNFRLRREDNQLCLINTQIVMLKDGNIIFSGTDKELWSSRDPYIQTFLKT